MCGILAIIDEQSISIEQMKILENLVSKRGPDHDSPFCNHETTCGLKLQFKASVLHICGKVMEKQPVLDDYGNVLLFNGQIYELSNEPLVGEKSDTAILFENLRQCQSAHDIADIFSSINGPFAFIYWHNEINTLFCGRDIFGRKSLCLLHNGDTSLPCAISSVAVNHIQSDISSTQYTWSEVDCLGFHCYQFNNDGQLAKRIKFLWNLDEVYPQNEKCRSASRNPDTEYVNLRSCPLVPLNRDLRLSEEFSEGDKEASIQGLEEKLLQAVDRRIKYNRQVCLDCRKKFPVEKCLHSKIAVAFSGGIDSTMLALALDKVVESHETIDLTTVAFKNESPDRLSVGGAYRELRRLCPSRNWRLILCDIPVSTLQLERKEVIRHLISPCNTVIDDSLGCGCWFISQAAGRAIDSMIEDSIFEKIYESFLQYDTSVRGDDDKFIYNYTSPGTIFFAGMSIDEQLGGYSSHRSAWSSAGVAGVFDEICRQMRRISSRNLGRDDRTCSHHGRDVKLPYLDFSLVNYLNQLPIALKMDLSKPLSVGPKKLLRELALQWGLIETSGRTKRALQFGTRIANLENSKEHGNEVCSRLIHN